MIADIRKVRGLTDDPQQLDLEAEKSAKMFGQASSSSLPLTEFLSAVGQLKFRGTSHLLRSPISVVSYLKGKQTGESVSFANVKRSRSAVESMHFTGEENINSFGRTEFNAYDIATHSVRVRKSGTILDIHSLWDIEHSGMFSQGPNPRLLVGGQGGNQQANRIQSYDRFNQESQPNEMLNGLRYFERAIPRDNKGGYAAKPAFDWGEVDRGSLAKCIIGLCTQARELLMSEPRLIELSAPVYILGDIHGNFPDLTCFEKALWRLGPVLTPAAVLFLGDYVDRGAYGVEVVSYLFAQKILAPGKFNLLRGNHEIRDVQQMFTFYTECVTKFGDKTGPTVWEAVNTVFDAMPLAAVVDRKVFCAHGGIPPPWIGNGLLRTINSIPCPLPNPEGQSELAWELLWSDPVHSDQVANSAVKLTNKTGFGANQRRGTGHVFSEEALNAFLTRNNLSHVVRAHEVQQAGFQVQLGGKLLTVFSSSRYCGGSNEAACILADKCKLRTIRIDTA
jgi:diadenosine tetraphosphatase ApaH/serine/threonine PP2A family protein phosphatase